MKLHQAVGMFSTNVDLVLVMGAIRGKLCWIPNKMAKAAT